jgi:hypothetical protein
MKKFPIERILPEKGVINTKIFENKFTGLVPTLFFSIEIELKAIDITDLSEYETDKAYKTRISLDWIKLNVAKLEDIANKTFSFPINPEDGYIDASMYMFHAHNMIYTTSMTFGAFENQKIPFKATLQIDFEYEGTDYQLTDFLTIETDLEIGELTITDVLEPTEENLKGAKKFADTFIDTTKFVKPILDASGIKMGMKV